MITIHQRYKLLLKVLTNLEHGEDTGDFDSYWCSQTVAWLWKQHKITEEELHSLCDRVIELHSLEDQNETTI